MKWVNHNAERRKKHLPELLAHVRFPLIPPIYLLETVARRVSIYSYLLLRKVID